jgi:hypothetical protein
VAGSERGSARVEGLSSHVRQEAPGELEDVRTLLNTWLIPNDTREPTDRLADYAARYGLTGIEALSVGRLRDALRVIVERHPASDALLSGWIEEAQLRLVVRDRELVTDHADGLAAGIVATVVDAIAAGRFDRLKACPDCHWVFYDNTRNATKRWCLMTAGGGPNGRSCGTIAKVRAYRQRRRAIQAPSGAHGAGQSQGSP